MKKINNTLILITGILLFLVSYNFDQQASLFFKYAKFAFLDFVLGVITNFGIVVVVMLLIPSVIFYKKNKKIMYLLWLAFFISIIVAFIIKLIVLRQRPIDTFTYPFTNVLNYSFPSMHAMAIFSLLPLLVKHLPKQKHLWIGFGLLAVFSRIYFGFHFLSDVVFGALAGYFIEDYLLKLYEKKKYGSKQI
ncbi:phosphatase PAP2 family protein [Candidatus Woesearchaeota archaeon]|nr:phosphatase PAP2 family protein [Candidatus Woesearchaeota archaeon]